MMKNERGERVKMSKNVVWINVEKLGIDEVNIRGGAWVQDDEFAEDIRNNGILNPLLVRPAKDDKYAVICGSRRYNAGILAGITEFPCFIEKLDDVDAMGRSIAENKYDEGIPAWRYAIGIGEMFNKLNHNSTKEERIEIIMFKTSFSRRSVQDYIDIFGLPKNVFELMKSPEERSEIVQELLKKDEMRAARSKSLSYNKAAKIARELRDYPKEKMFEVAAYVVNISKDIAFELIENVKTYPKKSMDAIYNIVVGIPKGQRWFLEFDSRIVRAIHEACLRKQIERKNLVIQYVENGLIKDGFL